VVAVGAAIQGGVLTGEVKDVLLLDVTPLSLGIETLGGVFTKIIESNTTIPKKASQVFSTAQDNQPSVEIHVLQGERPMANQNRTIGRFNLDGIPTMRKGEPQIEVTFDIDANGILSVSAKEMTTGKHQQIRIEASTGLSKDEIDRMKREAELNADTDKKAREFADKINEADSVIYQTEKQLTEIGDKLPEAAKAEINSAINELKEAHAKKDVDAINAWANASQHMGANPGQEQGPANGDKTEPVTDVDFEEVK